jgi:hypothetical protein
MALITQTFVKFICRIPLASTRQQRTQGYRWFRLIRSRCDKKKYILHCPFFFLPIVCVFMKEGQIFTCSIQPQDLICSYKLPLSHALFQSRGNVHLLHQREFLLISCPVCAESELQSAWVHSFGASNYRVRPKAPLPLCSHMRAAQNIGARTATADCRNLTVIKSNASRQQSHPSVFPLLSSFLNDCRYHGAQMEFLYVNCSLLGRMLC